MFKLNAVDIHNMLYTTNKINILLSIHQH